LRRTILPLLATMALLLLVAGMLFSSSSCAPSGALFFLAEGHQKEQQEARSSSSSSEQPAGASAASERDEVIDAYRKLPLSFVANAGQTDEAVRYYAQGAGYGFFFTPKRAMLSLTKSDQQRGTALGLSFLGANPMSPSRAEGTLPARSIT
jgi:hypothetical protein